MALSKRPASDVEPGRLDRRVRGALVLLAGQPRVLLGLAPPGRLRLQALTLGLRREALALGLGGLALPLLFLLDGALRPPPDVERLRLVRLDAQRRVAPHDRRAELAGVELGDGLADQRGGLGAAPRRRFGLLPRQLDLGAQVLEHARVGAVAGGLVGVRLRLFERAVDDGAAGAFDGVADPFLPRPFPGRLLVDRGLGAMADLPRLVEAGLVELGFGRGPDRPGPVLALERGAGPLHARRRAPPGCGRGPPPRAAPRCRCGRAAPRWPWRRARRRPRCRRGPRADWASARCWSACCSSSAACALVRSSCGPLSCSSTALAR